jgi:hypothetical protein
MAVAPVRVQVIEEVTPFGEVPLAPAAATGRTEAELARAIVEQPHASDASSLTGRLASVAALMRRSSRAGPDAAERKRAA